jgi:hypothetical protein
MNKLVVVIGAVAAWLLLTKKSEASGSTHTEHFAIGYNTFTYTGPNVIANWFISQPGNMLSLVERYQVNDWVTVTTQTITKGDQLRVYAVNPFQLTWTVV